MQSKKLSKALVDEMVASKKLVTGMPEFDLKQRAAWADGVWPVFHEFPPVNLKLLVHLALGEFPLQKCSVSLMWNGEPVRRLCYGFAHRGMSLVGAHLHCYDDKLLMNSATELVGFPTADLFSIIPATCHLYGITFNGSIIVPTSDFQTHIRPE